MTTEVKTTLTEEQWLRFCDAKVSRFDLSKPFYANGMKIATDGRILIAAPSEPFENTDGRLPDVTQYLSLIQADCTLTPNYLAPCDKCNDTFEVTVTKCDNCDGKGICEDCYGSGRVECDCCGQDTDCRKCDGHGKCSECKGQGEGGQPFQDECECADKSWVWVGTTLVARRYCRLLHQLGDVKVANNSDPLAPLAFQVGDARGIIATMTNAVE